VETIVEKDILLEKVGKNRMIRENTKPKNRVV
jgi:hypothetical protein